MAVPRCDDGPMTTTQDHWAEQLLVSQRQLADDDAAIADIHEALELVWRTVLQLRREPLGAEPDQFWVTVSWDLLGDAVREAASSLAGSLPTAMPDPVAPQFVELPNTPALQAAAWDLVDELHQALIRYADQQRDTVPDASRAAAHAAMDLREILAERPA